MIIIIIITITHHHHQVYGGCEAVLPKRPEKAQPRCCLLSLQVRTTNFHKGCHTNNGNCKWTSILYSMLRLFQEKRKRRTMLQSSKHPPSSLCSGQLLTCAFNFNENQQKVSLSQSFYPRNPLVDYYYNQFLSQSCFIFQTPVGWNGEEANLPSCHTLARDCRFENIKVCLA